MLDMRTLALQTKELLKSDPLLGHPALYHRLCFDLMDTTWAELLGVYQRVLDIYGPIAESEARARQVPRQAVVGQKIK